MRTPKDSAIPESGLPSRPGLLRGRISDTLCLAPVSISRRASKFGHPRSSALQNQAYAKQSDSSRISSIRINWRRLKNSVSAIHRTAIISHAKLTQPGLL